MDNDTNNQQNQNVGANPENGANEQTPVNTQGNTNNEPHVDTNDGGKFTQKDLDDAYAKARGTAERETTKKLMAKLGLKPDEEDKLEAFKTAYQNSLSDEEKRNTELQELQAKTAELEYDLEETDYTIKALIELTGKNESDVDDIVKMSKGLKTDENTIEDCIKKVISMINPKVEQTKPVESTTTNIPTGQPIQQPSQVVIDTQENPFKPGPTYNFTKQGEIFRTNPELAKKLASEAGVELKF